MIVLGLMSGTSADAIDAALVRFEEREPATLALRVLHTAEYPFPPDLRKCVIAFLPPRRGSVRAVCDLNFRLGEVFAEVALKIIEQAGISPQDVDLIASHGQTIYHLVEGSRALSTLQIGHPAIIVERTGITVAADFRPRDIAAGGQGAPLVSYLDALLFADEQQTVAVQNIGGIANATILPRSRGIEGAFAFDTGPGNGLIDAAVQWLSGGTMTFDRDGDWAAWGSVDEALLADLMVHAYFKLSPPKSTGKEMFGPALAQAAIEKAQARGLPPQDILATLTALTARSIAAAYRDFGGGVGRTILSGGGARNRTLLRMLSEALPGVTLQHADECGIPSDAKEAIAFALLGYQLAHGRPNTLPGCTGAVHAASCGSLTPGRNFAALMAACLARSVVSITKAQIVT